MYNDLFFYNIKKNDWTKVTAPNAPPPRSSHQVSYTQNFSSMYTGSHLEFSDFLSLDVSIRYWNTSSY